MNRLQVRYSTLADAFTLFGVLFYTQVIGFFLRLGNVSTLDDAQQDLEGNLANQVCGLLTLLVPLFFFIRHKVFLSKSFYRQNLFLLLFLGCVAASISWSSEPMLSFKRFVALLSVVFFAGFIAWRYSLERIAFLFGCVIGAAALVGLIFAVIRPDIAFISGGIRDGAFRGVFAEKNAGARLNAIAILLLLPMIRQRNPMAMLYGLFALIAIGLAQSATAIALIVAGTASYAYFITLIRLRINRSLLAFTAATLVFFLLCGVLYANYAMLLELVGRDPSLTDRTLIWELLQPLIDAQFLKGYGFGAFWASADADAFITRWGYIGNAHSGYVETLLNGGLIQLIALLLMFAQTLSKRYRAITADQSARYQACALVIIGLFVVTNYVAYVIPNYRSGEFLIFCVLSLTFRHHLVARPQPLPAANARPMRGTFREQRPC
ncbi:O-antigen ligase family protein [Pseudomonas glycinis]|jgi:O-antigen ligase|uniref:O-antigen ligase family protein n=1 Tax=Pseudomonas TaxID=286 RepID=UPI000D906D52|nr:MULTISPECIES: O-antigen ligase family protein [Pseudomonas]PYB83201.1 polymerase [Pseudomonas koreensis]RRW54059.1 O-antigen ligase family protein [Pseudomonas moraviensis]RRW68747.1 O-antigen ligase family protein [Pseudomonas fluorescens]